MESYVAFSRRLSGLNAYLMAPGTKRISSLQAKGWNFHGKFLPAAARYWVPVGYICRRRCAATQS